VHWISLSHGTSYTPLPPLILLHLQHVGSTCIIRSSVSSASAFLPLTLGRSANAIDLLLPPAPDLKARCFDFLSDLLVEHSLLFSSAELIAAFSHIPSSSYNATLESASICSSIRSAFFLIDNLVGLGFRGAKGDPVTATITADPSTRPAGICYFAFRSTVHPSAIDPRISFVGHSVDFWLALPQSLSAPTPPSLALAPPATPTTKRTLFSTPSSTPRAVPVLTAADLKALPSADLAALGSATSTDLLSDYSPDCYVLFTANQLRTFLARPPPDPSVTTVLSPRMLSILGPSKSASRPSYFGSLDFLDSQSVFDSTFPNPVPLLVTISSTAGVSIDSTSLLVDITFREYGTPIKRKI
jgi:hypothetical protein